MLAFSVKKDTTDPVWMYMYNDHVFRAIDFIIFLKDASFEGLHYTVK